MFIRLAFFLSITFGFFQTANAQYLVELFNRKGGWASDDVRILLAPSARNYVTYAPPKNGVFSFYGCEQGSIVGSSCYITFGACSDVAGTFVEEVKFIFQNVNADDTLGEPIEVPFRLEFTVEDRWNVNNLRCDRTQIDNPNPNPSPTPPTPTVSPSPTISPSPSPSPKPVNISVSEIKFAQVVYNPQYANSTNPSQGDVYTPLNPGTTTNFTAVLNKSASFAPVVNLTSASNIPLTGTYQVLIKNASGTVVSQSQQIDISTLSSGEYKIPASAMTPSTMIPFKPTVEGLGTYSAEVVTQVNQNVLNNPLGFKINAVKTYSPTIGLFRLNSSNSNRYLTVKDSEFNNFKSLSSYLSAVLPVADQSIQLLDKGSTEGMISVPAGLKTDDLALIDMKLLDAQRRILNLNRAVLVADPSYMQYLGDKTLEGFYHPNVKRVAAARSDRLGSLPHELGHTFGINYDLYESTTSQHPRIFDGFDATMAGTLGSINQKPSFMDETLMVETPVNMPWIDNRSYSIIFNTLRFPDIDPKTVLISGLVSKNGVVSQLEVFDVPNGVLSTPDQNGDLVISTVDKKGVVLNSVAVKSDFNLRVRRAPGDVRSSLVELNNSPFSVELPANPNIASVQLTQGTKQIFKSSLGGNLLISTINRIPLDAFKAIGCKRPAEKNDFAQKEKNVLIKLAEAAQRVMDSKHPELAPLLLDGLILSIKTVTSNTYYSNNDFTLSPNTAVAEIKKIKKSLLDNKGK